LPEEGLKNKMNITEKIEWYLNEKALKPGTKVKIGFGSGIDSNKTGVIVAHGNRKYEGQYKPVDRKKEHAIKLDSGEYITMFKNRVIEI